MHPVVVQLVERLVANEKARRIVPGLLVLDCNQIVMKL